MGSIKLTFSLVGGKRCYQNVPIEVADTVPLFRDSGVSDFSEYPTTLSALSLYWKCYKRKQPIPLSASLQERIDFIVLAESLGEELFNRNGHTRAGLYCEVYMTEDDIEEYFGRRSYFFHSEATTVIHIRSNGRIIASMDCWSKGPLSYSLSPGNRDKVYGLVGFMENGKFVNMYDDCPTKETTFDLVRECCSIFDILPSIPRKWRRDLPIENCDREYFRHILMCFKRVCPQRIPAEVLGIILNEFDFYEDWNRIIFDNINRLPKSAVRYMMDDYYVKALVFGGPTLDDKIRNFVTEWPPMAALVWKTIPHAEMAEGLSVPKRRRAGFIAAKTPNELLLYFDRIGRIDRSDQVDREMELMIQLLNVRSIVEEIKIQEKLDRYRRGNRMIGRTDPALRRLYRK